MAAPPDDDKRLREAARAMLAILSGDRLRKLVAEMGRAVAEDVTAAGAIAEDGASRASPSSEEEGEEYRRRQGLPQREEEVVGGPTHLYDRYGGPRKTLCGRQRKDVPSTLINHYPYSTTQFCPECVRERGRLIATEQRGPSGARRGPSRNVRKTDAAEAFVQEHLEGVTTAQVASRIDQSERTADSTLRHVSNSRGTIERREGRWYPADKEARRPLYQPAILRVLGEATEPLGARDVLAGVKTLRPEATLKGVAEEMHRMREASPPMIDQRGEDEHGLLYCLPGGDQPSAVH